MPDMTRQHLKKNELEDFVIKSVEWVKSNRQLASSIGGSAAVALILIIFFFVRFHTVRLRAEEKLSFAEASFYQGKQQDGVRIVDEIISQYPGTNAEYQARLQKTLYLLEIHDYDAADKTIIPVTQSGKPGTIVPIAMSLLGAIKENAGKYGEAIQAYNEFLDRFPEHYYAPKIYESLARVYEITGSMENAKATYEKLATLYPSSAWSAKAQERIAAIARTPQTPPKPQ